MHLQERDIVLLKALCKSGVLNNELVQEIYDGKGSYYKKRLTQMSMEGYLVRDRGYVRITSKGMAAVGVEGAPKKLRRVDMKRRVAILSAVKMLPDWKVMLSSEIKKKKGLNKSSQIHAYIEKDGLGYGVYMIETKTIKPVALGKLWQEIQEMNLKGIERVIMLFRYAEAMSFVASRVKEPKIKELLLLPYPDGMELFRVQHNGAVEKYLQENLPGITKVVNGKRFVDYWWQGNYVVNLITNDAVKRYYLREYFEGMLYQIEKRDVVILCTDSQRILFAKLYPLAKIVTVNLNGNA